MAAPPMDPLYEQTLRDEVNYLHSLWYQGPPRAAVFTSTFAPPTRPPHLQPSQATQFKKKKKEKARRAEITSNKPNTVTPSNLNAEPEWVVPTPPPLPPTEGWPCMESKPDPHPRTLSPGEQSKLSAKHAHRHALKAVTEYFRYDNADNDSDSVVSGDEDADLMEEDDGQEEYNFFCKVFKEDMELRECYEKNFAKGEFSCLVCGALGGKKMWKKYKGCLALVQHSITIAKMKKRRAHRALGQAVCKVLSWDINELSSIVSLLSDKSAATPENGSIGDKNECSMAVVDNVVSSEGDIVECKNDETVPGSGSMGIVDNVVSTVGGIIEGKSDEAVPESGSICTGDNCRNDETVPGSGPMATVDKFASIEGGDIVEGKNDEAVPESIATEIMPNVDSGVMAPFREDNGVAGN
ncbi:hypothetical protein OROHE_012781 [Orobanche hederae]